MDLVFAEFRHQIKKAAQGAACAGRNIGFFVPDVNENVAGAADRSRRSGSRRSTDRTQVGENRKN